MARDLYWRKTRHLTIGLLVIWVFITFVLAWYAQELNAFSLFGFPLGFYMAAQGSLVIYLAIIWYYNRRMRQLEAEFGIDDEQGARMLVFMIGALRAIVEMLGLCLIGQGLLYLLAGERRQQNAIYRFFELLTRPPRQLALFLLPKGLPEVWSDCSPSPCFSSSGSGWLG